jgi:Fic family protein
VHFKLPVTQETLAEISKLDRFQGTWSAQQAIPPERLRRIEQAARIQSVGASARIAGIHVSDTDVAALLQGEAIPLGDAKEILGYARAMSVELPADGELLSGDRLRQLHAEMLGAGGAATPSPWREHPLHREAFDSRGHATGQVFPTLPPRFVQRKTEELATWLEFEMRTREQHPVLVVAAFLLCLLSISPFERANGRLALLLGNLLLRRAGYSVIPYASLESRMEELREECWSAISRSQTQMWTDDADFQPWLDFFLTALGRHREQVEQKIALERRVQDYPPLQRAILETIREHGSVDAALLIEATGANRNTLKDNLRRLVQRGVLEKIGQRRATRYRMSTGEPAKPATPAAEH